MKVKRVILKFRDEKYVCINDENYTYGSDNPFDANNFNTLTDALIFKRASSFRQTLLGPFTEIVTFERSDKE